MGGGDTEMGAALALPAGSAGRRGIVALFTGTMLVGAFLVFSIQPLFARLVLPLLGGSPAVWNTAMVFFQGALLAGYGYAHLTSRWLRPRRQIALHLGLLALASISLPVAIDPAWAPPTGTTPVVWLIALLTWSLGLPFLAVAATAPLLQKWFAATGHPGAADPYFLYGASNLGSVLALLSYPLLVEPALTLDAQSRAWTAGYGVLALAIVGCALVAWRGGGGWIGPTAAAERVDPIGWGRRLHWLALALVPSSLLLAVTAHVTTDLAAVPLLWVVPLTLYLLTFVIVFARRPWPPHRWVVKAQPFLLIPLALLFTASGAFWISLPLHLSAFFVTALVCHGELARRRPPTSHLTEFYFWMALGGMVGGVLAALVAPVLLDAVWEYPIALVAACLLRPPTGGRGARRSTDLILPLAVGLMIVVQGRAADLGLAGADLAAAILCLVPSAVALYALSERPTGFAPGIAAALAAVLVVGGAHAVLDRGRSFFGVYAVTRDPAGYNLLLHGTTIHGAQHVDPTRRREPLTYYHRAGPLGQLFGALGERARSVAVVGLGVGTTACYHQAGQRWTFYEIDSLIVQIAMEDGHFDYVSTCAPQAAVVLGDARLSLERTADRYDLLILDAFSSDAIPIHLMTREALALYLERLAPGGVIAWHLSNRNLDLAPIVGDLIADAGVVGRLQHYQPSPEALTDYRTPSSWAVIARRPEDLGPLAHDPRWTELQGRPGQHPWTDDFSNIVSALHWRLPR